MYDNSSSDEESRLDVPPARRDSREGPSLVTGMVLGVACILVVVALIVAILLN